jgi:twinkle protein
MKTRSIDPKSNLVRLDPQVGRASFFGWHLISRDAKVIIVTEDEFDAMAVYQATGEPAVALAAGASYQLPIELVDKLDKFDQIYLWMHDNVGSQEVAKKWADKLGRERVYLVPSKLSSNRDNETEDAVSAWEAFSRGTDLTALIKSSKPLPHQEIVTFKDLREEVYRELAHPEQVAGVPSITFPSLNKILRGHRRGELTVFTGPTGIGKTTILAQMSLDYLRQGVSTLWGSFEINNVRLAKKMITQFAEKSLEGEESLDTYESVADKFSSLPLHFMRFHGNTGLEAVFDAMEYAVYVYDVEHIVLDNLQFMTPTHLVKGFDKFDQLDMSIARLRKFATSKNIHITIIIHPRKEDDGATLSTSSVFGTAKATQESDNVVILQKGKNYRYIEVTKNRFSGDLGRVPFRFDPATLKFSELTQEEVSALDAGKPYVPAPPPTDPSEGNDESVIPPPPQSLMDDTVLEHASSAAPVRKGKKKAQRAAAEVAAEAGGGSVTSAASEAEESSALEELAEEKTSEAIAQATESGEDNLGIDPSRLQAMPESNHTDLDEDGERKRVREKLEQAKLADKVVEAGEAASNAAKI